MTDCIPLAHSAPTPDRGPHSYRAHISAVTPTALGHAARIARHVGDLETAERLHNIVGAGAHFHDLGKLDEENQTALRQGAKGQMPWDHIDAGVAHLSRSGAMGSAWIVRAHHAPGLPNKAAHFSRLGKDPWQHRKLRGRRNDLDHYRRHAEQIERTDGTLAQMLATHTAELGYFNIAPEQEVHSLFMRLALSCLVDADHADTAGFSSGIAQVEAPKPRWKERLQRLDEFVARLQSRGGARNVERQEFYDACRQREPSLSMATCQGPVGIGKTTAVLAYLLRRAIETHADRLFVIAPYTAILTQTARRLRECLLLPDEISIADSVVAEHHHRADFSSFESRDLATLWRAPIVLTTAVQFFETLSACAPAQLRKLHGLPGSVVFIDESHTVLPAPLWPQNWRWMRALAEEWNCSFVYASGSLARFWSLSDVIGDGAPVDLEDLVPVPLIRKLSRLEGTRIHYRTLGRLAGADAVLERVISAGPGPRLLIVNTVYSAGILAKLFRDRGHDVLHISTALTPTDRATVLQRIQVRLANPDDRDWTLVATSLVEAGLDFSFRIAFRERFSLASLIQVGGRVNRHGEGGDAGIVFDFLVGGDGMLKVHPGAVASAEVLGQLFDEGKLAEHFDAAALVTEALQRELVNRRSALGASLIAAERASNYPEVQKLGRVIDSDTELVVIDAAMRERLERGIPVGSRELLSASVQMWGYQIREAFRLEPIGNRQGIFWWPFAYDPTFLGYMRGVLEMKSGHAYVV